MAESAGEVERMLRRWLDAGLAAVAPSRCVPPALPSPPAGRTVVVGAGKAAAAMAAAVEASWSGPLSGAVIVPYGHDAAATRFIDVYEAAHPVPDEAGVRATETILGLLADAGPADRVLVLLSGGGSALLTAPQPPLSLADKQALTEALLRSGAPIEAINLVRRQLSRVKGGRLALHAYPAPVTTVLISDVPGDDPAVIASGPTAGSRETPEQARAVLDRYGVSLPAAVERLLATVEPPPRPEDPRLAQVEHRLAAGGQAALQAGAQAAREDGVTPLVLGDTIEGEAREAGRVLVGVARSCRRWGVPVAPPCVLLSGGETTVTVHGAGRGGRNTELALAAALALERESCMALLSADTDGIDGRGGHAGALADVRTAAQMRAAGIDPWQCLAENDSYRAFEAVGGLLQMGATQTNVNDFRALWVG